MANNNSNEKVVPGAKSALNQLKFEIANQVGVQLSDGYNGNIAAKDAGRIGGNITKRLVQMAEQQMAGK